MDGSFRFVRHNSAALLSKIPEKTVNHYYFIDNDIITDIIADINKTIIDNIGNIKTSLILLGIGMFSLILQAIIKSMILLVII